jgi:uncharacterized membrane protein
MRTTLLSLALVAASFTAAPLRAQQVIDLPLGSWANDITPDGTVVVGTWNNVNGFIWRWQTDPAPTVVVGGDIVGVSDDGSTVVGTITDPTTGKQAPGIWTEATGWQSLLGFPGSNGCPGLGSGYDISGDGSVVVGLGWEDCSAVGFRWTQATGMQPLENLVNGTNRCSAISGDGTAMGGFAQGSFTRTPAYWLPDLSGFVIDEDFDGEVFGFSEDGNLSVGTLRVSGQFYDAYIRDATTGLFTNLGNLNPDWHGNATDISEDGTVVVGYDVIGLAREAWVWTSSDGLISLNDRVDALGITGFPDAFVCRAVSDDGKVVVGGGIDGGGGPFGFGGFIVVLDDATTWANQGGGTPGINGVPTLSGAGTLTPGSTASLSLDNAPASTLMLAWLSFTSVPQNFFGGTIYATPFNNQFLFSSSPTGTFSASTAWPAGVPAGTEVWFQFILSDPSVTDGLTLSNAQRATKP